MRLDAQPEAQIGAPRPLPGQSENLVIIDTGGDFDIDFPAVEPQGDASTGRRRHERNRRFRLDLLGRWRSTTSGGSSPRFENTFHVHRAGTATKELAKQIG